MIGMNFELRMQEESAGAYFMLYVDERNDSGVQYVVEVSNVKIAGISDQEEVKKPEDIPQSFWSYAKRILETKMYSFYYDEQNGISKVKEIQYQDTDGTVIFNGFDRNALLNCPYSEVRELQHDSDGRLLLRYAASFQRTDIGCMCKYIRDYLNEFSEDSVKHRASLVIKCNNWADARG